MSKSEEERNNNRIVDFYNGKSIFITGAAGFVGGVLLEVLLRYCTGIQSIYILLRGKKGMSVEARKEAIFKKSIFNNLKEKQPELFDKIHVVTGDITMPDLGLNNKDLMTIIKEVSIVFHCAASISFFKPLKYLLSHNVGGLDHVIELCKRLKHCESLVYTSTAYSNSNRRLKIEERVYRLPYSAQRFLDELNKGNEYMLHQLFSECQPAWLNYYSFSKCLAENLLLEKASDIPTAIIRPALVAFVWKGSKRGYLEDNSSLTQLAFGIGKGFLKVLIAKPETTIDLVPVDVVANAHVIAAWKSATQKCESSFVVNCTSFESCSFSYAEIVPLVFKMTNKDILPNTFRYSNWCWISDHPIKSRIMRFFEHYIPAAGLDLASLLAGKKPRMVCSYRVIDKLMKRTAAFTISRWTYETENLKLLDGALTAEEKNMFYTDMKGLHIEECTRLFLTRPPNDWTKDKKSKPDRIKYAKRMYHATLFIQAVAVVFIAWALTMLFSKLFNRI